MRSVYLVAFSYSENRLPPSDNSIAAALASAVGNSSQLFEVRVGFIGVCARFPSDTWVCSSSFETISNQLAIVQAGAANNSYDPLGILDIAKGFKDTVTFDGLMLVPISILGLSIRDIVPPDCPGSR